MKRSAYDTVKGILASAMLLISLYSCTKPSCEVTERTLTVLFTDSLGFASQPVFTRVYGIGGSGDISIQDGGYKLPIDTSSDSSLYVFENETRLDTLAFTYGRVIDYRGSIDSYCMQLTTPRLIAVNTMDIICLGFDEGVFFNSYNCTDEPFEVHIRY